METSTFTVKVQKLRRIVIPPEVCEGLDIHEGDKVRVIVKKEV